MCVAQRWWWWRERERQGIYIDTFTLEIYFGHFQSTQVIHPGQQQVPSFTLEIYFGHFQSTQILQLHTI